MAGTLNQVSELLFALAVGLVIGLAYDFFQAIRELFRGGAAATAVSDVLFCCASALIYLAAYYTALDFAIRWYAIAGNLLGFALERKSLSVLLAKFRKLLYNLWQKRKNKRKVPLHDGDEN